MESRRPSFCAVCGADAVDAQCPAREDSCWDVRCRSCGTSYGLHYDDCIVREGYAARYLAVRDMARDIVKDLSDRPGLDNEWHHIDDEIRAEIVSVWEAIVVAAMKGRER